MNAVAPPDLALGIICNSANWQSSNSNDSLVHCLTRGQSIGLVLTTEAACLSLLAVVLLFAYIIRNLIVGSKHSGNNISLIRGPADVYMLSLLCADMIQAVGTILDIRWIREGKVEVGDFCTAQGVVQQLGEAPVAMNTLVIAVHTFLAVWIGGSPPSLRVATLAVGAIWLFVAVFLSITVPNKPFYETPTPYWCWIRTRYTPERIAGEYIWLWLALAASFAMYIPLFLFKRGIIRLPDPNKPWKMSFRRHRSKALKQEKTLDQERDDAYDMLAYPLTYSIIVLPLSIVRWLTFSDPKVTVPSAATFFIITLYGLSGFANVLLIVFTRPGLLTFGRAEERSRGRVDHHAMPSRRHILPSIESTPSPDHLADVRSVEQRNSDVARV